MTVSKRLSRANSIATNDQNLVVGKLESVEVVSTEFTDQNTGETEEIEQIEWIWSVPTKLGTPTKIYEWSGLNVNEEKTWHDGKNWSYNKLTTILIQCGLLTLETLAEAGLEEIDIESLIGREFKFELERRANKKSGIKSIKLSTLKLV